MKLLRAEDHFVFSSSASQFVSIDKTGNISHVLDAGSDQEAQSVRGKVKTKQNKTKPSVKKNPEVGESSLEETETRSTLPTFALLARPLALILATVMPALSADHIPRTEDSLRLHRYPGTAGPYWPMAAPGAPALT